MQWVWLAFAAVVPPLVAHGETRSAFNLRRWTTDDGLPANLVTTLAQTPDGYLWLGSRFGLTRFDGVRFTVFNRHNTSAFAGERNDAINGLATAPDGALWVAIREGLVRCQNGQWSRHAVTNAQPDPIVWDLAFDTTGRLWIDTAEHVGVFPDGPFLTMNPWRSALDPPIRKLSPVAGGSMVAITQRGPIVRPGGVEPAFALPPELSGHAYVNAALPDTEGGWWLGAHSGLWHRDGAGNWRHPWVNPTADQPVDLLFRDAKGALWAGVRQLGLHRFNGTTLERLELLPRGTPPDVAAFCEDQEGSLWVGTTQGLFQLRPRVVTAFTRDDGLPDDHIQSVSEGPDGTLWLGTDGGLARISPGSPPKISGGVATHARRCVLADSAGTLWSDYVTLGKSGWEKGLGLIRENGSTRELLADESVWSLFEDRERRMWVGTERGVRCFRGETELQLAGLPKAEVRAIHETRDGAVWFGTKGQGALRWRDGELTAFTTRDGLADDRVFTFHEDADGFLWIGTHNGLTQLRPGALPTGGVTHEISPRHRPQPELRTFTTVNGLLDNLINHILEDDAGFLWFSCNRGLFRLARAELNAVAEGRQTLAACGVFGTADGMPSSETNGEHQPAGCKGRDGRLWFPTTRGVVVVDPLALPIGENPPAVVIEEVAVDGEPVSGLVTAAANSKPETRDLKLAPGRARLLRFRYTAPTFVNPERARFRHRLRGLGDTWREAGEERVAYFNDLKPGAYTFEVTACNAHGVWQPTPVTFAFSLAPRFTQTGWFPGSLALGGAALVGGFVTWRLRWQRRSLRAEQTAALAEERARIARDLHDELGTALTGVALELDVLRQESASPEAGRLGEAAARTRVLAERMREVVWAVNPHCDTVPSLALFLEQQAVPFIRAAGIACRLDYPEELPRLPLAAPLRHQLALGVREALTNVVRHSGASEVWLRLGLAGDWLTVEVADNGRGFDPARAEAGHGLVNLRERFALLKGSFTLLAAPGCGTRLTFSVPVLSGSPLPT